MNQILDRTVVTRRASLHVLSKKQTNATVEYTMYGKRTNQNIILMYARKIQTLVNVDILNLGQDDTETTLAIGRHAL
jgi:hypothetical protein